MAIYSINFLSENNYHDKDISDIIDEALIDINNDSLDMCSILSESGADTGLKIKEIANNAIESIKRFFRDIINKIKSLAIYTKLTQLENDIKEKIKKESIKEIYAGLPSINLYMLNPNMVTYIITMQMKNIDGDTTKDEINSLVKECEPYFSISEKYNRNDSSLFKIKGAKKSVADLIIEKDCTNDKLLKLIESVKKSVVVYEKTAKSIESELIDKTKKAIYSLDRNDPDFSYKFRAISNRRLFIGRFMKIYLKGIIDISNTNESNIRKYVDNA